METLIYDVLRRGHEYEAHRKRLLSSLIALKIQAERSPGSITGALVRNQWEDVKETYKFVHPKLLVKLNRDVELQKEFKDFLFMK